MAKLRFIPSNVVSQRVTGVTCWTFGCEVPTGGTANTASIATAGTNTTSQYQVTPGANNSTGAGSLPTSPNGKGWIIDLNGLGSLSAGTHTLKLRVVPNAGTWTITAKIWKVQIASNLPTNAVSLADVTWTGVTSATAQPLTDTINFSATTLADGEFMYMEVWARQTAGGASGNNVAMEVNNPSNAYWWEIDGLSDTGMIDTSDKTNVEVVVWSDKVAMGRDRWGETTFIKDMATNTALITRDEWSASAANDRGPVQFQHLLSGSGQNQPFQVTPGDMTLTRIYNNPLLRSAMLTEPTYASAREYYNIISMWLGAPMATYTNYWIDDTTSSVTINLRYANTSGNFTTPFDSWAHSTAGAGVDGWFYRSNANAALYGIPDNHRSEQSFGFFNDGSNINNSAINAIQDGTNFTTSEWGARVLLAVEAATASDSSRDKWLNNFNDNLAGPPDSANARLAVSSGKGTIASNNDTGYNSIKNGFDYQHLAYRLTANASNEVVAKLEALGSYGLPFRAFIIEGYTGTTAPVVGTSATEGGSPAELDSGVSINAGVTYKGTNYASHVDTATQTAFVVIYGEQTAGNATWYTIKPALSQAHVKTLTETITLSDDVTKRAVKALADSVTLADAVVKTAMKKVAESITASDAVQKGAVKALAETISLADTLVKKPIKKIADTISLADDVYHSVAKKLTETITLADGFSFYLIKRLAEQINLTDSTNVFVVVALILTETITVADASVRKAIKALSETINVSETMARLPRKVIQETIALTDTMAFAFAKVIQETVSLTDTAAKGASKKINETIRAADALARSFAIVLEETITVLDDFFRSYVVGMAITFVANVRQAAGSSLTFPRNVLGYLRSSLRLKARILKLVGQKRTFKTNMRGLTARSLTEQASIQGTVASSLTVRRNVLNHLDSSLMIRNRILRNVANTLTVKSNILTTLVSSFTMASNVLGLVASSLTIPRNFIAYVAQYLYIKANIAQLAGKSLTTKANVFEAVGKSFSTRTNFLATLASSLSFGTAEIRNLAGAALTVKQNVAELVASTLETAANVRNTVGKALTTKSSFFEQVPSTLTLGSSILGKTASSLTMAAGVLDRAGKSLRIVTKMGGRVTKPLVLRARVLNTVASVFTFTANVLTKAGASLTIVNASRELVGRSFTTPARIAGLLGKNLVVKGRVRNLVGQDLIFVRGGVEPVGKSLTFKMGGEGKITSNFPIFVQIRENVGSSLTMNQSILPYVSRPYIVTPELTEYEVEALPSYIISPVNPYEIEPMGA